MIFEIDALPITKNQEQPYICQFLNPKKKYIKIRGRRRIEKKQNREVESESRPESIKRKTRHVRVIKRPKKID